MTVVTGIMCRGILWLLFLLLMAKEETGSRTLPSIGVSIDGSQVLCHVMPVDKVMSY